MGNRIKKDVTDLFDNRVGFLAFIQSIAQSYVYSNDVVDVPEHLFEKVRASIFR